MRTATTPSIYEKAANYEKAVNGDRYMKNIKSPTLWGYIRCCFTENAYNQGNRSYVLQDNCAAIFSGMFYIFLVGSFGQEAMPLLMPFLWIMVMALSIMILQIQRKPSLYNLMPMRTGKKMVYFFISLLFMTVVASVIIAAVMIVFAIILAIILAIATGQWILVAEETAASGIFPCAESYGLVIFIALIALGSVLIIAFIKRRLLRDTLMFLPPLVIFAALEIFTDLTGVSRRLLYVELGASPFCWILLTVTGVVGGICIIAGIVRFVLYLRTKDY